MEPVPASVVQSNSVRRHQPWTTSHLHSFRVELLFALREDSLRDPLTGNFWDMSVDQAFYLPLLELAGHRARHIWRVLYIYNYNERSLQRTDRGRQLERSSRIRRLPSYAPLERLPSGPVPPGNEAGEGSIDQDQSG
jgi:hypothetical protein